MISAIMIGVLFYKENISIQIPNEGVVIENEPSLLIKTNEGLFVGITDETILISSKISFNAEINEIKPVYLTGQFDYVRYLKSQNIKGSLFVDEITVIGNQEGLYSIRQKVSDYLEHQFDTFLPYIRAFVLADTSSFDESFFERVRFLGISHIFALSGLHVTFVSNGLDKWLSKYKKPKLTFTFISVFLLLYLALASFSVSFIRAFFLYIFLSLNRIFKKAYTAIDGLSLVFIISLCVNPYIIFDFGFLLSYSVTLGLLVMTPLLNSKNGIYHVSWLAFLMTLPLVTLLNGFVNVSSILINIPIVLFLGILLPISYLVLIFPFLEDLFTPVLWIFETIINFLYEWFFMPFTWPFNQAIWIVIYYLLLVSFLFFLLKKNFKGICIFIIYMVFLKLKPFLLMVPRMTMLEVDGDSFLIEDAFNQCNIMIDGGTEKSAESLVKHLKLTNIKTIDYLVATHNHADHIEGLESILNDPYFKVKNILTPAQLTSDFQMESCGNIDLLIYPKPLIETSVNNSSVNLGIFINDQSLLFTGDIEEVREKEFITYPIIDYDILKVSHHGSSTSTTRDFLDHTTPEIALINIPYYNRHQFPHDEVLFRLKESNIDIYQSDKTGNVSIYFFKNKPFIYSDN